MRHEWETLPSTVSEPNLWGKRRCRNCGAVQEYEQLQNWMRIVGYRWYPLVGRCKGKSVDQLTITQVAARLGCTPGNVRNLVQRGRIRATKVNARLYLISIDELKRFQRERKR